MWPTTTKRGSTNPWSTQWSRHRCRRQCNGPRPCHRRSPSSSPRTARRRCQTCSGRSSRPAPAFSGRQGPECPTATDEATNPAPPRRAQSCGAKGRCGQLMRRARRRRRRRPRREASARLLARRGSRRGSRREWRLCCPRASQFSTVGEARPASRCGANGPRAASTHRRGSLRGSRRCSLREEPDDQSPNQVTPGGAPLRRENSSRGPPRREAPEFSPSAAPARSSELLAPARRRRSVNSRRPRRRRGSLQESCLWAPANPRPRRRQGSLQGSRRPDGLCGARAAPAARLAGKRRSSHPGRPGLAPASFLAPPRALDASTLARDAPKGLSKSRASGRRPSRARDDDKGLTSRGRPAGRSLRREGSSRGPPRREAPEFSPSADPGSLLRASSLRRERSTRQLAPETPTRASPRVSPRVLPLGAGQAAPETTTRVSPRVAPAGRSLRRENSSRGPPRRVAPEFAADPEPPGQAAATEAEAPETAAAPPRRATSLRRERSSRKL